MTTLRCVLVFLTMQMVLPAWGQAVAEQRHGVGPAKERDPLDLSSYRQRTSLSDLIGEAKMDEGLVDDNMRSQIVSERRLLNSVLAQLQKARTEGQDGQEGFGEISYEGVEPFEKQKDELNIFPEYTEALPENRNWERGTRQLGAPRHSSICVTERNPVYLNNEEFEYRPAQYEEIRCLRNELDSPTRRDDADSLIKWLQDYNSIVNSGRIPKHDNYNKVCLKLGFSCVQWNKTIHLTRRRHSSACWEPITRLIPAGCECMWPDHKLGDIKIHM